MPKTKRKPVAKKSKRSLPAYRNPGLPVAARAADLVSRMTLEEKVTQLNPNAPAIARLGMPPFFWCNECLHGLVHTGRATVFPQAIGLAATFDAKLIAEIADAIATEARAKFHELKWHKNTGPRVGLTFWTPVINIVRDPRWGRAQETYGEDPVLAGLLGAAFVRGLQGNHPRYMKAAACAKHFAVHSGPEKIRTAFDARVSKKDLAETYLPAFKFLVDAGVESVMAAYNRVNGEACSASPFLLTETLRGKWNYQGHVVSDGGAVHAIHMSHKVTATKLESAIAAITAGCDMDVSGSDSCFRELIEGVKQGLIKEEIIDQAARRLMSTRIKLGLFDDDRSVPFTKIESSAIQSPRHLKLAREAAAKSTVLLKNNGLLPLKSDAKTIFVAGPNAADVQVLLGNFYRGVTANAVTILEGIVAAAPDGVAVTHMQGCFPAHPNIHPSTWAFGLGEWADVNVAVVGLSPLMEGESGECIGVIDGGDRADITLPEHQLEFVRRLKKTGKPLVVIVTGGSPIALGEIHDLADAVLFAWYPGEQGGSAIGDILFGKVSPSGRLPVTFPKSIADVPAFDDYRMDNRTYRFSSVEPLYPFGFGLSYVKFAYGPIKFSGSKPAGKVARGSSITAEIKLTNQSKTAAEEVVQLYLTDDQASTRVPRSALKAIQRITLAPKQSKQVKFTITPQMMAMTDDNGEEVLEPGTFTVTIAPSSPTPRAQALGAPKPATAQFELI